MFKTAVDLKYDVDRGVRERAYDYLERELGAFPPDVNEGWWPSYTAWQAFAVKVLVEGGRSEDSHLARLYGYRDRMPVFALAYMHDALLAKGETSGERIVDLRRRMSNAILPEGGSASRGLGGVSVVLKRAPAQLRPNLRPIRWMVSTNHSQSL